jgi:hypothetical protein
MTANPLELTDDLADVLKEAAKIVKRRKKEAAKKKTGAGRRPTKPQFTSLGAWERHYRGERKECPHCEKSKRIVEDFGARPMGARGVFYVHSWCTLCRSSTNYYALPRTYHTKNSD